MKTYRYLGIMLVAALAVGCTKEKADRISIFAEDMGGSDSKVWMDPSNVNTATWVAGEAIDLNGNPYTITDDGNGGFYLDIAPQDRSMYAIYPATTAAGGNDITVENNNGTGSRVTLRSLAVNFLSTGGHTVCFPMESQAAARSSALYFNHLTGNLRVTLADTSASPVTLGAVKIVLRSTSDVAPISHNGVTVSWAVQGPTMPGGEVGEISGDQDVKYSSEMYFVLKTDGNANATIAAHGSKSFCVPVTVPSLRYITVTGYNPDGSQRFTISKDLGTSITIARNRLRTIPAINIK